MENKYVLVGIWVFFGCLLLGVIWFLVSPFIYGGTNGEYTFYIRVLLILAIVHTFSGLRLYNAIVNNTRFSIKLREAVIKLQQNFPALQRAMTTLNSGLSSTKDSLKETKKSLDANTDETHEVTELLRKVKNNAKAKS